MAETEIVTGQALHQRVIVDGLLTARSHVWIATADLKDMHVAPSAGRSRKFVPILDEFDRMASTGVTFRVVHGSLPSRPFRETLEGYPRLTKGALELQICPRSHWKIMIVDHRLAYCGSANFTGAGLGARSEAKRNLEIGVVSTDPDWIEALGQQFDAFWIGEHCDGCKLRDRCPDPIR
jgi:phosphatidylserine/phosphatidylglycerophosphate/cardiolipin synthase-like enzyme